jgi:hypothetical protein
MNAINLQIQALVDERPDEIELQVENGPKVQFCAMLRRRQLHAHRTLRNDARALCDANNCHRFYIPLTFIRFVTFMPHHSPTRRLAVDGGGDSAR